jgi:ribosomal protein L29
MQVSLAERVLEEIGADRRLRMRLAELIVSEPEVRLFMLNSILPDVARKEDVKELRNEIAQLRGEIAQLRGEINQEIAQLRGEIAQLRREMYSNFKWTIGIILTIWGATVIPILLKLVGAI